MTKRFPEGATTVIGASAMSKLLRGTKGRSLPVRISNSGYSKNGANEVIEVFATNQL